MPDEPQKDEQLMEAYKMGDMAAFELLFRRHSGRVLGFLSSRAGGSGEAKDLLQEVFLKLHRSRHLYDPTLPFSPWLFSVTRSVTLDYHRRAKKLDYMEPSELDRFAAPSSSLPEQDGEKPLGPLSGMQRQAVHLRVYDEATFEEIATRLSTSPENARQLVSRGLKRLRRLWPNRREES